MSDLFFWRSWRTLDQIILAVISLVAVIAIILALTSYILSPHPTIVWEVVSRLDSVPIPFYTINLGFLEFDFMVENYLITQYFQGSALNINSFWALLYLVLLGISLVFSLSVITTLSRFWFIFGMVGFILLMMNFKLEQLLLFDRTDQIGMIIAFFLYLPLSYYLHAFRPDINYSGRLMLFGTSTLLFGFVIFFASHVETPFLHLANYGIFAPVIISIIFIFIIAHEIVFGFLYITTAGSQSRKSLAHFMVITIFYLINLVLLYLHNRQKIDWNLIYLNEYLMLLVSAILGLWGIKKRNHLFHNILQFQPLGAYLYLSAAAVCFSTLFYLLVTANDPLVETFEDAIVFSLIGFGVVSVLYVFANYFNLIYFDLPIHKVVYRPKHMPFWTARIGALLFVLGLFALSDNFPLNQAIAGYYNGIGDLYSKEGQQMLAEGYYENAGYYGFQNHRSNYALAQSAFNRGERPRGFRYLTESIKKKPTPHAFANLANYYDQNNQFFDALFTLQEGLAYFPNNPALLNNIALLYGKSTVLDSLFFYAQAGMTHNLSSRQAQTNLLAKLVEHDVPVSLDSIEDSFWPTPYNALAANFLAFANQNDHAANLSLRSEVLQDSVLDFETFSLVFNYMINQSESLDSSFYSFLDRAKSNPSNRWCEESLMLGEALAQRRLGNLTKAYATLINLKYSSRNAGYYECSMGLWAMEERDFDRAVTHFESAGNSLYPGAQFYRALALLFGGREAEAKAVISELSPHEAINEAYLEKIKKSMNADSISILKVADDEIKYFWILLNNSQPQDLVVELWRNSKGQTQFHIALALANRAMDNRDWPLARQWLENSKLPGAIPENLIGQLNWAWVRFYLHRGSFQDLNPAINSLSDAQANKKLLVRFTEAKSRENENRLQEAEILYRSLATANPYLAPIVIESARFFQDVRGDSDQAYELLLQAMVFNTNSIDLRMAYTLQCLKMGLTSYAELSLAVVKKRLGAQTFASFEEVYKETEIKLQDMENKRWEGQGI